MNEDPIVAEVRRTRDKLARQFNYDIHAIFADLRTREHTDDPAHPLVQDANEWADAIAEKESPVLREKPVKADSLLE
jgi:hypothetical protein